MKLVDVYDYFEDFDIPCRVLLRLLEEREPHENISHKAMPTWEEHFTFVGSQPYAHWYLIEADDSCMQARHVYGAVYLSKRREIGVGVLKAYRGKGLASAAVVELMRLHPGRFLWNVAPLNTASIALARKLGFGPVPVQYTYAKEG